jgi:serine/threonine-protein kinase HipA
MSVNRKFKNFEVQDLLAEADRFKIGTAKTVINQVRRAILNWPQWSESAGLPEIESVAIQKQLLVLG